MILDSVIDVPLSGANIKYYENLGYDIPRVQVGNRKNRFVVPKGTTISVNIRDVTKSCHVVVNAVCDYCGAKYRKEYYRIIKDRSDYSPHDSCGSKKCSSLKSDECKINKYGSCSQIDICSISGSRLGRYSKYTFCDVKNIFDDNGLEIIDSILDDACVNVDKKLRCICKHHKSAGEQLMSVNDINRIDSCCLYGHRVANYDSSSCRHVDEIISICNSKGYSTDCNSASSVDSIVEYVCNAHIEYGLQRTTLYGLRKYKDNCKMCAMSKISGDMHYNWKGGMSSSIESERKSVEYKRWRDAVYKRDRYTCRACGRKSGDVVLNAHHINNFSSFVDLRYDVDNGITLCEECHLSRYPVGFHKIYGTCNNNIEQINEFLINRNITCSVH